MNGAMPVLPLVRLHAMGSDNLVKFEADYLYLFTNRHGVTSKKTPVLYVIVSLRAFPHPYIYICIYIYIHIYNAVAQLADAPRYKPEGRGFDSRCCHWNFSLT